MIGGTYMTIKWTQIIFTLIMNKIFSWTSKIMGQMTTCTTWNLLIISHQLQVSYPTRSGWRETLSKQHTFIHLHASFLNWKSTIWCKIKEDEEESHDAACICGKTTTTWTMMMCRSSSEVSTWAKMIGCHVQRLHMWQANRGPRLGGRLFVRQLADLFHQHKQVLWQGV